MTLITLYANIKIIKIARYCYLFIIIMAMTGKCGNYVKTFSYAITVACVVHHSIVQICMNIVYFIGWIWDRKYNISMVMSLLSPIYYTYYSLITKFSFSSLCVEFKWKSSSCLLCRMSNSNSSNSMKKYDDYDYFENNNIAGIDNFIMSIV